MTTNAQESQPFRWRYDELDDRDFQIRGRTLFFIVVLFSLVLLITFLFLYTRWICRSRATISTTHSVHLPPNPARGLDSATIESFPVVLHRPSVSVNETECSICLGVFEEGEKVRVLPNCYHCYHSDCVDLWLHSQSSCPLCRGSLRVDSAV